MAEAGGIQRHRHEVDPWTVGRLREMLHGLPDDMVLRAEVATTPSTWADATPWGNDQFVVTGAAMADHDHVPTDELVLRIDFPTD